MWIELHQNLRGHPKLIALREFLEGEVAQATDLDWVRAKLENLWLWALDYAPSGELKVGTRWMTLEAIGTAAGVEHPAFGRGLLSCGWIDQADDGAGFLIHDWAQYGGKVLGRRAREAARIRAGRDAARGGADHADGADATSESRPEVVALAREVVDIWNDGREPSAKIRLTSKRLTKVGARLQQFTPDQIKDVVRKLKDSPWHQGHNNRGWVAPGPEWVLESVEKVEQWLRRNGSPQGEF